ncbi:MAG: hypothetical protein LKG25_01915 [Prevotella sp.]|jgi:uncharacterized protein with von Willebrand factor type A (vWA) domain|nr:hypothetical protein [Prevotella sp.]
MGDNVFQEYSFYMRILRRYVDTGIAELQDESDALNIYLVTLMNHPLVKVQVLGDEVGGAIFTNVVMRFVHDIIDKMKFKSQLMQSDIRQMGEVIRWTSRKKQDGWQGLLNMIGAKCGDYGFDKNFYKSVFNQSERLNTDKTMWEKMIIDWNQALIEKMKKEVSDSIEQKKDDIEKKLNSYLEDIPKYIEKEQIDKREFKQAWGMMNGSWSTSEFQRFLKIVHLQSQYPQIIKITNKMGRIADEEGTQWMSLAQGTTQKIEHSSRSDILGVTIGNDLNAMMATEMVYASDEELEDIFLKRYVSHRLQVFRYKSEIMKPVRQMNATKMIRRGPMIVCIDTSASMIGRPEKISYSVLLRILAIANLQKRPCFLIGFSVSINPIDVSSDPNAVMDFFSKSTSGETNAKRMLEKTFELLENNDRYMNADILWVTDFRIPMPDASQLIKIQQYRAFGTCFYGLQIGISKMVEEWQPYFDEIEQIGYIPHRLY